MAQERSIKAEFILDLFNALPDAIVFLEPVFEDKKIVDFEIGYINDALEEYTGKLPIVLQGKKVLEHQMPSVSSYKEVFAGALEAYYSPKPVHSSYYNAYVGAEITVIRKRFKHGVLGISRSIRKAKV